VSSKPFEFIVGPEETPCYIHVALVAHFSRTLETLVTGAMKEAKHGTAKLTDIESSTFIRFIEFAYTGSYSVLAMTEYCEEQNAILDASDPWDVSSPSNNYKKNKKTRRSSSAWASPDRPRSQFGLYQDDEEGQMWQSFKQAAVIEQGWRFPKNPTDDTVEFSSTFLAHAQLYVFGDRYDVQPLRDIALRKLRCQLSIFTLHTKRISDVVDLLKYTYENTNDQHQGRDALRDLITDYVVCHIVVIGKDSRFLELLEDPGKMARDIMSKTFADVL
jgi:hypothetical protein